MRTVRPHEDKEWHEFAKKARSYFEEHPTIYSYADGLPAAGKLLALNWNTYSVLVLMVDENAEVLVYDISCLKD